MSIGNIQVVLSAAIGDECEEETFSRRGISVETARQFYVGYIHNTFFETQLVKFSYVLPLFTPDGRILGVKVHRDFRREGQGKCFWIIPGDDCKALWPPPEWWRYDELPKYIADWPEQWIDRFEEFRAVGARDVGDSFRDDLADWQARKAFGAANALAEYDGRWLFLCGGELKALAMISAGFWATSPMTGENNFWTPELVSRLAGLRICIVFDDDQEGRRFRDNTIAALIGSALEIRATTFGTKSNGQKMDANDVAASSGSGDFTLKVNRLLESAHSINADEWRALHPPTSKASAQGIFSADLEVLEKDYSAELYRGHARSERQSQYERYLEHYPPAVSGDGGHGTLLKAVAHRHGFGVSIDDAMKSLREYNARCCPAWSEDEIVHKLQSAKPLAAFPPGSRLCKRLTDDDMLEIVFTPRT